MISSKCFSKDWIDDLKRTHKRADPALLEKMIHAFELLGLLAKSDNQFIFKGGTSLVLLLPEIKRLSIDVDIVGEFDLSQLEKLQKDSLFIRVEPDERMTNLIPKKHFKFYFQSHLNDRESYVLLDVVSEDYKSFSTVKRPITSEFFETDQTMAVTVPTVNAIVGDKLTAFAPNSIGVPYGKNKSMEIIKQLFDLGELFEHIDNLDEIRHAYETIHKKENQYRGNIFSTDGTLRDTSESCYLISQLDFTQAIENEHTRELRRGVKQIDSHMLSTRYTLVNAKAAASRCVLVASAILCSEKRNVTMKEFQYDAKKPAEISEASLPGRLKVLNSLRRTDPESFYYWYLTSKFNPQLGD